MMGTGMIAINRILDLLENGPMATSDLRVALGVGRSTVEMALGLHLRGKGFGDKKRGVKVVGMAKSGSRDVNVWALAGKPVTNMISRNYKYIPDDNFMRQRALQESQAFIDMYRDELAAMRGNPFATCIAQVTR